VEVLARFHCWMRSHPRAAAPVVLKTVRLEVECTKPRLAGWLPACPAEPALCCFDLQQPHAGRGWSTGACGAAALCAPCSLAHLLNQPRTRRKAAFLPQPRESFAVSHSKPITGAKILCSSTFVPSTVKTLTHKLTRYARSFLHLFLLRRQVLLQTTAYLLKTSALFLPSPAKRRFYSVSQPASPAGRARVHRSTGAKTVQQRFTPSHRTVLLVTPDSNRSHGEVVFVSTLVPGRGEWYSLPVPFFSQTLANCTGALTTTRPLQS